MSGYFPESWDYIKGIDRISHRNGGIACFHGRCVAPGGCAALTLLLYPRHAGPPVVEAVEGHRLGPGPQHARVGSPFSRIPGPPLWVPVGGVVAG